MERETQAHGEWTPGDPGARPSRPVLAFTLVALAVAVARYPLLALGTHTFFDLDWSIFCQPVAEYNKAKLLAGQLPTWCPFLHNGVPYFAQWNTLLCYPGILLYLVLPTNWGLNLFQLLHLAFAGVGMFLLARRLNGGHFVGAAVIGLSYELNGVALSVLNWPQNLSNYAWVPWVIFLQVRAMEAVVGEASRSSALRKSGPRTFGQQGSLAELGPPERRPTSALALAGLATGVHLLTGLPEFNVIAWTFSFAIGLALLPPDARWMRAVGAWLGAILLGFAVAAVQILPAAILVGTNDDPLRGRANAEWALNSSGLINLIHPMYDTVRGPFTDKPFTQIWMPVHYTNLGLTALAMVVAWRGRAHRLVWALVGVGLGWTLLAGGWTDPLSGPVIQHIPVISRMRYPIKFVLGSVVALHLLAALFWRSQRRGELRLVLAWTAALPVAAFALAGLFRWLSQAPDRGWHLGPFGVHVACGFAVLGWAFYRGQRFAWPAPLVGTAVVLLLNSWFAMREPNPTVPVRAYAGTPIREHCRQENLPVPEPGRGRLLTERGRGGKSTTPEEFVGRRRLHAMGNVTLVEGLPNAGGFVSVGPRWQERWNTEMESALAGSGERSAEAMLDFVGVRLGAGRSGEPWEARTNAMGWVSIGQAPQVIEDADAAWKLVFSTNWNPRATVVLERAVAAEGDPAARATVVGLADTRWEIVTETARPTLLVLAQSWYPGWSATVNGEGAEVLRVNLGFQGVVVPGGKAVVVLRYREPGLVLGFGVTLLGLGVCGGAIWFGGRRTGDDSR